MTQEEIQRIQREVANKTPGELIQDSIKRQDLVDRAKKLKKLRKYR